jgi:hypothetical protein
MRGGSASGHLLAIRTRGAAPAAPRRRTPLEGVPAELQHHLLLQAVAVALGEERAAEGEVRFRAAEATSPPEELHPEVGALEVALAVEDRRHLQVGAAPGARSPSGSTALGDVLGGLGRWSRSSPGGGPPPGPPAPPAPWATGGGVLGRFSGGRARPPAPGRRSPPPGAAAERAAPARRGSRGGLGRGHRGRASAEHGPAPVRPGPAVGRGDGRLASDRLVGAHEVRLPGRAPVLRALDRLAHPAVPEGLEDHRGSGSRCRRGSSRRPSKRMAPSRSSAS